MATPQKPQAHFVRLVLLGLGLALVVAALAVWLLRPRPSGLPEDHTIAREDFGSRVQLGMALADARATELPEGMSAWFLTREELNNRDPYTERPRDSDLLIVIYSSEAAPGNEVVVELRCYLQPEGSVATLRGERATRLDNNAVQELYGPPYDYSRGMDGRSHFTYLFAIPGSPAWSYKLTTSHEYDGRCFALALAQVPSPL